LRKYVYKNVNFRDVCCALFFTASLLCGASNESAPQQKNANAQKNVNGHYVATAYDLKGITASGDYVHRHVIAADPDIIPIGSRIKVSRAGKYSGEYVVADTGVKIQGRRLDIYVPSGADCMKFGKRHVRVRLVSLGDGTHQTTRDANQKVKQDVKSDLASNVVGNAATEEDWAAKHVAEKKGTPTPVAIEKAASAAAPVVDASKQKVAPQTTNPQ
jgi:3D (Asp-Asp-Asp) domain-containing protein